MARIRTVKPEFWEDEGVGLLSRDARLLFIATFNLADDEGLLRWAPAYLKANVFMYDDEISEAGTASLMKELTEGQFIFAYTGGRAKQSLGYIVNFRKHQNINRPGPSRLPPPSMQSGETLRMYYRRDNGLCHLCSGEISDRHDLRHLWPTLDHLVPRSKGGTDYPSNLKLAHASCNKSRRDRPIESFVDSPGSRMLVDGKVPPPKPTGAPEPARPVPQGEDDPWFVPSQNPPVPFTESFSEPISDGMEQGREQGTGKGTGQLPAPKSGAKKAPRHPREPDAVWDGMLAACGIDPAGINDLNRGGYNVAAKALRDAGATAEEMRRRVSEHRKRWSGVSVTPQSLAKHWPELGRQARAAPSSPHVGDLRERVEPVVANPESVAATVAAVHENLKRKASA